jgi:hypothetical protein
MVCLGWVAALTHAAAGETPASVCAPCHRAETQGFAGSEMTRTLSRARDSAVLRANPKLAVRVGPYIYEIARTADQSILTVADGKETLRVPVAWAFGQGSARQSFVFRLEDRWYESRVSYFAALAGLDVTPGMRDATPHSLLEAAGRLVATPETSQCFACHASNVPKGPAPDIGAITPGVECGRCHAGSEAHLQAARERGPGTAMRKLGELRAEEMSDSCGECHRTWNQVAVNGPHGIQNVKFPAYRLANSKCWDAADRRIRCTACHDPHGALETTPGAYDAKCTACHSAAARRNGASTQLCRVGTRDCVKCHMPKMELPEAHRTFTDHWIRVAKAGQGYPD